MKLDMFTAACMLQLEAWFLNFTNPPLMVDGIIFPAFESECGRFFIHFDKDLLNFLMRKCRKQVMREKENYIKTVNSMQKQKV